MSNDKNNLVYREQLDDNVIEMLSEDIGSNYSLRTENTKTIVAALNEILGKDIICNAIGSPLLTTDTFAQMGEKIHVMVNDFKVKLLGLGVSVSSVDKLANLIEKIGEIDLGVDAEELMAPLEESLREILGDEGVEISGEETLADLIVKVDEEFADHKQQLINILISKGIDVDNNDSFSNIVNYFQYFQEYDTNVYLYKYGKIYTDLTGEWSLTNTSTSAYGIESGGSLTKNESDMKFGVKSGGFYYNDFVESRSPYTAYLSHGEFVNFDNHNMLYFDVNYYMYGTANFSISVTDISNNTTTVVSNKNGNGSTVFNLDISGLTNGYKVKINIIGDTNNSSNPASYVTINKIYLI